MAIAGLVRSSDRESPFLALPATVHRGDGAFLLQRESVGEFSAEHDLCWETEMVHVDRSLRATQGRRLTTAFEDVIVCRRDPSPICLGTKAEVIRQDSQADKPKMLEIIARPFEAYFSGDIDQSELTARVKHVFRNVIELTNLFLDRPWPAICWIPVCRNNYKISEEDWHVRIIVREGSLHAQIVTEGLRWERATARRVLFMIVSELTAASSAAGKPRMGLKEAVKVEQYSIDPDRLKVSRTTQVWTVKRADAEKMLEKIKTEQETGRVAYNIIGFGGENCFMWARRHIEESLKIKVSQESFGLPIDPRAYTYEEAEHHYKFNHPTGLTIRSIPVNQRQNQKGGPEEEIVDFLNIILGRGDQGNDPLPPAAAHSLLSSAKMWKESVDRRWVKRETAKRELLKYAAELAKIYSRKYSLDELEKYMRK